ncbi:MAG: PEGA domain-containing protein [Deltaproteobacteria bacterium]|nr:PEGA domain-containing protein [Deltaproteobacteria bacterium]
MRSHVTYALLLFFLMPTSSARAKNPSRTVSTSKKVERHNVPRRVRAKDGAVGVGKTQGPMIRKDAPAAIPSVASRGSGPRTFSDLRLMTPVDKLSPVTSVRLHDRLGTRDRAKRKTIRVLITTSPNRAAVTWGGRALGKTPVTVKAPEGSTPMDLVIRRRGFMTLRTRVQRRVSRKYFFKLHPAKFR